MSQTLAIHATTAAFSCVMYLKKNMAVTLLTPMSNKSNDGKDDCTKKKINNSINISAMLIPGISHKNKMTYCILKTIYLAKQKPKIFNNSSFLYLAKIE